MAVAAWLVPERERPGGVQAARAPQLRLQLREVSSPAAVARRDGAAAAAALAAVAAPGIEPARRPEPRRPQAARIPSVAAPPVAPEPPAVARTNADLGDETGAGVSAGTPSPPPPLYRTRMPAPVSLHYEIQRGGISGSAELRFAVDEQRYTLQLRGQGGPGLAPHWSSTGAFDAAGIAPERFAVARRGRERHAANFDRENGRIGFSGPSVNWPLVRGAQDRLSWLIQLAAIAEANPALLAPGQRLQMWVVGAHGDAGLWEFEVRGAAPIEPAPGAAQAPQALLLVAEPAHAWAPHVQVWLDPARQHLPVRLELSARRGGESTTWRLLGWQPL